MGVSKKREKTRPSSTGYKMNGLSNSFAVT
jgi:hypothetical protein